MDYKISFQELAQLQMEQLAKQGPVTLEEARAQVLRIRVRSSSKNKEQEIKNLLEIYHPDWTKDQIDAEYNGLVGLV